MRFTWFNLMPWPDLPEDFREKNRSVWVDITLHTWDATDALGLDDFTLVCHSMGGMIAADKARHLPPQEQPDAVARALAVLA